MKTAALALAAAALAPVVAVAAPLERREVAGGWFLEPARPEVSQLGSPSLDTAGARFLTALVEWDDAQVHVRRSAAVVATADGRVERIVDLQKQLPLDWRLSGDGASAAVLVQDVEDPGADRASLVVLDVKTGAVRARQAADVDARIVAGRDAFALAAPSSWLPDEEREEIDVSDAGGAGGVRIGGLAKAELRPAVPLVFVRANGDRVQARVPLAGEVAPIRADGGFAVLGNGRLTRVDASLGKVWDVALGFEGSVAASEDGSLVVVAEQTPGRAARRVLAFGRDGRKRAEVTFPAPLAVDLAVAPDGSGFLLAAAPLLSLAAAEYDGQPDVRLACYDADGRLRWSHVKTRDVPSRAFTQLALGKACATAVAGWVADDGASVPEVLVLGKDGKPVYRTEGPFDALALDGTSLWTLEGTLLSRLTLRSLAAGTATVAK